MCEHVQPHMHHNAARCLGVAHSARPQPLVEITCVMYSVQVRGVELAGYDFMAFIWHWFAWLAWVALALGYGVAALATKANII